MKLILHIGMGKTGTSSIQAALRTSGKELAEQRAHYLGMWFEFIDPAYGGFSGSHNFFRLDQAAQESAARGMVDHLKVLKEKNGTETFILSNESIFGNVSNLKFFIKELGQTVDLSLLAYVRNPYQWLPSAFTQWGLYHKTRPGPLKPFQERAQDLVETYSCLIPWIEGHGDKLTVRNHDTSIDVVADFSRVCGVDLKPLATRVLERSEPAEILLRAAFNDRHSGEVHPDRFNNLVMQNRQPVKRLTELSALCFEHDDLADIVTSKTPLFEDIRDRLGPDFDFLSKPSPAKAAPDQADLQRRLIDYLVEITFQQAERIKKLEIQMQDLTKEN
ncbi:MAG: hypothetical protein B7X55_05460 [Rhodobacterales bacterium 34-62-10]|nr:MAG: hypothetical protein B7X55_05460 [Rhodobacterales bacterium 34-62-10]